LTGLGTSGTPFDHTNVLEADRNSLLKIHTFIEIYKLTGCHWMLVPEDSLFQHSSACYLSGFFAYGLLPLMK
jgi:hypothetical protein